MTPILQRWDGHPENAVRDIGVFLCAVAVLVSVGWSFANYHQRRPVSRGKRSVVDTFTMLLFFVVFCRLIAGRIGALPGVPASLEIAALVLGFIPLLAGCAVNLLGRRQLGANWANQIAIYQGHTLLTAGTFALVRHPLYASLVWMFIGASIAYLNGAALLITLLVFLPAMLYRARQEEKLLLESFPQYAAYRTRTGAFFPRFPTLKPKTP